MSLLEDIFLRDETEEAQSLERIIEGGDEFENVQRDDSDNDSPKEDEAEEEKTRVDPTKPKRVTKNPRFTLNPARLTGPRGIQDIPQHFKNFRFKGKGHEKDDLDLVLKRLEHWAYRLYPKFAFHDCLKKIEVLGKKRPVMVHLHKIRSDQLTTDEPIVQQQDNSSEDEQPPQDEFDVLLQQQIEKARATPHQTPYTPRPNSSLTMPKAASSPSISDDQRERMIRNRKLAEERRLAKLKANNDVNNTTQNNYEEPNEVESNDKESPTKSLHQNISKDNTNADVEEILAKIRNKNAQNETVNNNSSNEYMEANYNSKRNKNISINFPSSDDSNDGIDENHHKVDYSARINKLISSDHDDSNDNNDDITNNGNKVNKNRKSNVISSDSEEEMEVFKQSIVVDVHTNNELEENINIKRNSIDIVKESELNNDKTFDAVLNQENNEVNMDDIEMNEI